MAITHFPIDLNVSVDISKENVAGSLLDFGLLCLVTENIVAIPVVTRYKIYPDFDSVIVDFNSSTPEYLAARSFFSQVPTPRELMIACVDTAASETYVQALTATYALKAFYAVQTANLLLSNSVVQAIAQYVQTKTMIFSYQTSEADVLNPVTTDIASLIKAQNLYNTSIVYYDPAHVAVSRFDSAFLGMGLTQTPGTFNWAYKNLVGIIATSMSETQRAIALGKGVNIYQNTGNAFDNTQFGTVSGANGGIQYLDLITGIHWLKINLQQAIFQRLISSPKVAQTDAGYAIIGGDVLSVLTRAVKIGILADSPAPSISYASLADTPLVDRQARRMSTLNFVARSAGAINFVNIVGSITI